VVQVLAMLLMAGTAAGMVASMVLMYPRFF